MPRPPLFQTSAGILFAVLLTGCSARHTGGEARPGFATSSGTDTAALESETDVKRRAAAHAHYANGVILELQSRRSRALAEFAEAAELAPGDEELVWEVARRFIAAGQSDGALQRLQGAAELPGASALTWARLATVQLQTGHPEAARDAGRRAIGRDPEVLQGYQCVFLADLQAGRLEQARAVLQSAEAHGSGNAEFLIQLSELHSLLRAHDPQNREAAQASMERLLEQAATLTIQQDVLRMRLADGFASLGQNDRAAELYQHLLETMSAAPGARDLVRSKLTEAYLRGKDPSRAREQLEQLLKRDPTNVRVCYLLGSLAYESRDFSAARDYFERVLVLRPEFEQAYYDLAGILLSLDLTDEADEVIDGARRKFPQSFAMEMLSALVHMRRGEDALAIKHFTTAEITAQATDPERLTHFFYFQFGAASEQAGEHAAAERHLRKSLELNPDFAPAQNYLGYLWAERGERLEEALELIERAVGSEPGNAAYLDSLAWVLFKLDRPEDALARILESIEHLEEPDATVQEHLGDIRARLGDTPGAVEAWWTAYRLQPSEALRQKLEQAGQSVPEPKPPEVDHE